MTKQNRFSGMDTQGFLAQVDEALEWCKQKAGDGLIELDILEGLQSEIRRRVMQSELAQNSVAMSSPTQVTVESSSLISDSFLLFRF